MQKKIFVLFVSFVCLIIAGCSSDKVYNELIEKGLENIEQKEYVKAEVYFEDALEEKATDETASVLLEQTKLIQQVEKDMTEGDIEEAESKADTLIAIEDGSDTLVERVTKMKEKMAAMQSEHEKLTAVYDDAAVLLEGKEYDQSIELIEEALQADIDHPFYEEIKKELEELEKLAERAKEVAAAAKKEEEEKKAKEAQRKKAEQAAANKGIGDFAGYWLDSELACHITSTYMACALPYSDYITNDGVSNIEHISNSEVKVTFSDGTVTTLKLSNNNSTLHTEGGTYRRVSKEEANAIYDGYYELP